MMLCYYYRQGRGRIYSSVWDHIVGRIILRWILQDVMMVPPYRRCSALKSRQLYTDVVLATPVKSGISALVCRIAEGLGSSVLIVLH